MKNAAEKAAFFFSHKFPWEGKNEGISKKGSVMKSNQVPNGRRTRVCGLVFAPLTPIAAACLAKEKMEREESYTVFTPGATIHARALRDEKEMSLLRAADLLLPDGQGVLLASRLVHAPLPERCAGIDFAEALLFLADKGTRFFFYGGREGVAREAAARMKRKYPHLVFAYASGYGDDPIEEIRAFAPHALFVCLGYPNQETYILSHREMLSCLCVGLGGSLDVWAGRASRAPAFFQKWGLEWAYRTVKEPRRITRLLPLPSYFLAAWREGRKKRRKHPKERDGVGEM